ncbi:MAG: hypothetical protein P1U58_09010 [Verrucomicrobiales bacterium]|nr:hypothetical protein [Verrucomicrobiales bacterium]
MKNPLKIIAVVASAAFLMFTNTSCTSTEAAIVGGIAGAAIGAAIADDHGHYGYGRGHGYRRGGGYYGGGYGYRGGYCPH